jgi:hypothetical protein
MFADPPNIMSVGVDADVAGDAVAGAGADDAGAGAGVDPG